jgi:hypothetical protein
MQAMASVTPPSESPGGHEDSEAAATGRRGGRFPRPPVHPILLALYPVLFLYGENLGEATPSDLIAPLVVVALVAAVVYAIARLALGSGRAALATSLLVIVFFGYGRVLDAVRGTPVAGGRLLVVAAAVVLVGLAAVVLVRRDWSRLNRAVDVLSAVVVLVTLSGILAYEVPRAFRGPVRFDSPTPVATQGGKRDVYYIVIEDIGAPKTLQKYYGLKDPSVFDWLEELGFVVAEDSKTNYGKTIHMLASTMNMEYLDEVAASVGTGSSDYHPLYDLVDDNAVGRFMKSAGYRYVHIGSWWDPTERSSIADVNFGIAAPSDFTSALLKTTILPEVTARLKRFGIKLPTSVELSGDQAQYDGAIYGFQKLEEQIATPGPKFVFAHFLIPHDPYVFGPDGTFVTPEERAKMTPAERFLGQALYTNSRLEEIARKLLAGPEADRPIVIIQTDEGPNPPRYELDDAAFDWTTATQDELDIKYPILNAFYLPGVDPTKIDPSISTVNTFRLVLSEYFGADLPLLPDRIYVYRNKSHPYEFSEITDRFGD